MKGDKVSFRRGYKYSLWGTYTVLTSITGFEVDHRLFKIDRDGWLTIFEDYPWDGASGPTWDTSSSVRASLVHDALYEMMRLGLLPQSCFAAANFELYLIAVEDGMWEWRARLWRVALDKCGRAACRPKDQNIMVAP